MNETLSGKVALLSGGASGIGAATAEAIVAAGGRVMIGDINEAQGRATSEALGSSAAFVRLDVTNSDDWRNAVDATVGQFGLINVLVNCAGVILSGALGEFSVDRWRKVIDVNLTGAFLGMSAAVEQLKAAAPASIINMSSVAGFRGSAGMHAYTASKFGVRGLTKSAAVELAPSGVRVNSVHPGTIRTPMTRNVPPSFADFAPMRRFGEAEEIANLIVFLASDLSSFSTGAEFLADGGETAGAVREVIKIHD